MWGPLKDTGKKEFCVRRQAEKQQPVYRLILLCAPNLVAASCEDPPLLSTSFFLLSVCPQPSSPSSPPLKTPCLAFIAAVSCMGAFPEQKQICLVRHHFLSPGPLSSFYRVWKLNREASERGGMLSLSCLCFLTLCFASHLLCIACRFLRSLWHTLNIIVTRAVFIVVQFLKDFLASFWFSSEWVNCIYSGMEPRVLHSWTLL